MLLPMLGPRLLHVDTLQFPQVIDTQAAQLAIEAQVHVVIVL